MSTQESIARKADARRQPCRPGEYIVVDIGGRAPGNTIIMADASSTFDAMRGRLKLMRPEYRRYGGRWVVTDGRFTAIYETRGMRITRIEGPTPKQEAEDREPIIIGAH